MSEPSKPLGVFVDYPPGMRSPQENFERTRALFARLRAIHPLFATVSPKGRAGSIKRVLSEPLLLDLTTDRWLPYYEATAKDNPFPDSGDSVTYTNRVMTDFFAHQEVSIRYNAFNPNRFNEVQIFSLAPALATPDTVLAIMQACIETFDGFRGEFAYYTGDDKVPFLFNKLWLTDGTPFPKGYRTRERHEPISREPADRYRLGHPPPPLSELWLDGTLYTWPDHDPALLAAQASERERSQAE